MRIEQIGDATLYLADCLDVLPMLKTGSVDAVVTDPPYGCNKAEWDSTFPTAWYSEARRIARMVVIITGSSELNHTIPLVGNDFVEVIAAWNLNGMTRSPIGFGNWLAATLAGVKPRAGWTFFEFAVRGDMPDHPCPKPIEYMRKLIARVTEPSQIVLDCFAGSGTTGVACAQLGRHFIGVEISEVYFNIAVKRIAAAQAQLHLPLEEAEEIK